MDFSWKIIIDAGIISTALLVATFLRTKLRFLQRFMVPNALTAGFILLPVYNYLMPALGYSQNRLGDLVYHLLSISFIAMTLRSRPKAEKKVKDGSVWAMSTVIMSQYAIQAFVGLMLTWVLFSTVIPGLSPAFGLTLPLGFAMGPGQAYAIGKTWEGMGFEGAGSVGLAMAALGYLWACVVGVALVNYGVRKGFLPALGTMSDRAMLTGILPADSTRPVGSRNTTDIEAIDPMTFHTAVVAFTYILSFVLLSGIGALLGLAGKAGRDLAYNLWGMNFIFSALTAMIVRSIINRMKLGYMLDDDSLSRLSGIAVDYMVTGSLAAISLVFVGRYWLPLLTVSTLGGLTVLFTVPWMCSRVFRDHRYERMIMLYGVSTGTLSTGLALLRILDPEFKSKVSNDYMLSAGMTFGLAIPFILAINLPAQAGMQGTLGPFWTMVLISVGYLVYSLVSYAIVAKSRAFRKPSTMWLEEDR
ncbi:MAG: sodium:glutamate symporter [Spirochaetae bacterium HGW-Spirochaetae-7]|nr:MAG: sodium:glutamate symporter [Spirochaetae bacterium HGW-Spirochaetae-7]